MGYWRLNEVGAGPARDFSPNGRNATWNGSLNTTVQPVGPNVDGSLAYVFDGTSAYLSISDNSALYGVGTITVEAWVYATSWVTAASIVSRRTAANVGGFTLECSGSGVITFYCYVGGSFASAAITGLSLNTWYHLVGTYDGANVRTYLNGVLQNTAPVSGTLNNPTTPNFYLGRNSTSAIYWPGYIADVAVYPVALSAQQVSNRYVAATQVLAPSYPPVLQVVIAGVDRTQYVLQDAWFIEQNWGRQGDMMTMELIDANHPDSPLSLSFTIPPLSTVTVKDLGLQQTLFGGYVGSPKLWWDAPNVARWELSCRDQHYLADGFIVRLDAVNQTADQMINNLVAQFPGTSQPGGTGTKVTSGPLTTNNVQPGPLIPRLKIGYQSLAQAIQKITRYASTLGVRYGYFVDENRDLHWFNQTQVNPRSIYFTDDPTDTTHAAASHYQRDYDYLWDALALRNSVIVRGTNYTPAAAQTDTFAANGSQTSWPVTFPPNTIKISQGQVFVGPAGALVQKSVGLDTGGPPQYAYIVSLTSSGQWFLRVGTDPVPGSGNLVVFTYFYEIPVLTRVDDLVSQQTFNTLPNAGVFQVYLTDQGIKDAATAKSRGQRELTEYANPQERVEFRSSEDFTDHMRAGDIVNWRNKSTPDSANSYAPGINRNYLIVQNRIHGRPGNWREYRIIGVRVS